MSKPDKAGVVMTILQVDGAPDPNLPSHLFPGCGSDGAVFQVTTGMLPRGHDLSKMIQEAIVDGCLSSYDEETGRGYLTVIDGDAPPVGSEIFLFPPTRPACDACGSTDYEGELSDYYFCGVCENQE